MIGLLNIDHPNIVKVRHLTVSNNRTGDFSAISHPDEIPAEQRHLYQVNAVVSDFVNGWDILNVEEKASEGDPVAIDIQKHCPTGIETAIKLGIPLADAIGYLHSKGITHRDIKPDNIIIDHEMNPRLVDFGFSKLLDEEQKTMTPCGTLGYMAPEIISRKPYDNAVDLWSLGSTLFFLTTGDLLDALTPSGIQSLSIKDSGGPVESLTRIKWFTGLSKKQKEDYLVKHYKVFENDTSGLLHVIINLLDKNPEKRMSAPMTCAVLSLLQKRNIKEATGQAMGTSARRLSLQGDSLCTSTAAMQRRHSMPAKPDSHQTSDRTDASLPQTGVPADSQEP